MLWHNLFGSAKSTEQEIIATFESNASLLSERKNGNVLYHEIISFSSGHGLAVDELTPAITDIGQEYLRQRASDQLAYGVVHLDTEHIHLHLMISANTVGHGERVRLPKKQFAQVQKDVEQFVLARYPELAQTRIYDQEQTQDKTKLRAHEQAMKVRTQKPSRKEDVKERLQQLFVESSSEADLIQRAKAEGITFYQRGKSLSVNVLDTDGRERKHRLSTLGLQGQYDETLQRFAQQQAEKQVQTPEPATEQTPQDSRENALRLVLAKREQIELESAHPIEQTEKTSSSIWLPDGDILFHHLNMNAKQAKEISLPGFLAQLGFEPARTR